MHDSIQCKPISVIQIILLLKFSYKEPFYMIGVEYFKSETMDFTRHSR